MINFLPHVPYYQIADRCKTCLIWYPKYLIVKCPCCHQRVRSKPNHRKKGYLPESEIRKIIKEKLESGWTILKNDDIVKRILEYEYVTLEYKHLR